MHMNTDSMMMRLGLLRLSQQHVQHDVLIIMQDIIPGEASVVRVNLSGFPTGRPLSKLHTRATPFSASLHLCGHWQLAPHPSLELSA